MIAPFDIFYVADDGHLMWKATAETLDVAKMHIKIFTSVQAGDYVIYSQDTGHKIVVEADSPVVGLARTDSAVSK